MQVYFKIIGSLVRYSQNFKENRGKLFWRLCGWVDGSTEKGHFDVSGATISMNGFPKYNTVIHNVLLNTRRKRLETTRELTEI